MSYVLCPKVYPETLLPDLDLRLLWLPPGKERWLCFWKVWPNNNCSYRNKPQRLNNVTVHLRAAALRQAMHQISCVSAEDAHLDPRPLRLPPWKERSMSSWKVSPVRNLVMRSRASQMG